MREEERISLLGNEEMIPKTEYLRNSKIIKTLFCYSCFVCNVELNTRKLKDLKMTASGKTDCVG